MDLSPSEVEALQKEVKELADEIRKLKEEKADQPLIKEKVARMLEKKKLLGEDNSGKFVVKFPKGTRDFGPKAAAVRDEVLGIISDCFLIHCAQKLDTPVYELTEVLLGKYGEEGGKLIFDLAETGTESLSLRYDLTVPFARYLALNKINHMKRYHIGKVYRRDQPVMTRGRYREFYQCDIDIAGQCRVPMEPEAECLKIVVQILSKLRLGEFEIKLNHRALLEGMFEVCGIPAGLFKTVCSSIDKLDKVPWADVRSELVNEKHVDAKAVNKLERLVRMREQNDALSNLQLLMLFENDKELGFNSKIQKGVSDLRMLLHHCESFDIEKHVAFDSALARGLDYYTGTIFETVYKDFSVGLGEVSAEGDQEGKTHVGTVAAGGRYDNLVEMFSATKEHVPCVGISFGVERLFSIMELKAELEKSTVRTSHTEVYVASAQKNLLDKRFELCAKLWDENYKTEMAYKANPKMLNQLQYCEERSIPLVAIVGQREIEEGIVKIRDVVTREEKDVPNVELYNELMRRLPSRYSDLRLCTVNERILHTLTDIFKRHGAETIDTPVFELKGTLLGKYGAKHEKCFVDLKDQGGEILSMRYDLTVPFARYLSMNKIQNMKRFYVGKVYRREKEAVGMCKEIMQCDFDIAGQFDAMLPDAECLRIVTEVLLQLGLQSFKIRINHNLFLQGLLAATGISGKQSSAVLTCLDSLSKDSWETISQKLCNEVLVSNEKVAILGRYLRLQGDIDRLSNLGFLEFLEKDPELGGRSDMKTATSDLRLLLHYCSLLGLDDRIIIDPTLIPWFDYYTGMVFAVTIEETGESRGLSSFSVAKGGRYDNLVGMFMTKKQRIPCVGFSVSMSDLEAALIAKTKAENVSHSLLGIEVFVSSGKSEVLTQRQRFICDLWNNGIKTEMCSFADSFKAELKFCEDNSIPLYLTVVEQGNVKVMDVKKKTEKVFSSADAIQEVLKLRQPI